MNSPGRSGKNVLLVDDDPLVQRIYSQGLTKHGFTVNSAADGLEAIKALHAAPPDVVVLDLMMPRLSGAEVLKFIHAQPALASLPVVVLSNVVTPENMPAPGIPAPQRALLKYRCTPAILAETLRNVLEGEDIPQQAAPPQGAPSLLEAPKSKEPAQPAAPALSKPPSSTVSHDTELLSAAREDFLRKADVTCSGLRALYGAWHEAQSEKERELKLRDFHRRVHFLSAAAGLAHCYRIALLAGLLEALLFQLLDQQGCATKSIQATIVEALAIIEQLYRRAHSAKPEPMPQPRLLILDSDETFNGSIVWALKQLGLQAGGAASRETGWQWLQKEHFDLVLVDEELSGPDGARFAQQVRALPGYQNVPVLIVSARHELGQLTRSTAARALLTRPALPTQLALQAITRLFQPEPGG